MKNKEFTKAQLGSKTGPLRMAIDELKNDNVSPLKRIRVMNKRVSRDSKERLSTLIHDNDKHLQ